jgi:hypothetical protein
LAEINRALALAGGAAPGHFNLEVRAGAPCARPAIMFHVCMPAPQNPNDRNMLNDQPKLDQTKIIIPIIQKQPKIVLRAMGLLECRATPVGSAMVRGVSGGQRKRVTTVRCWRRRRLGRAEEGRGEGMRGGGDGAGGGGQGRAQHATRIHPNPTKKTKHP